MTLPTIGFGKDAGVRIDLGALLERRLLIQAASGAGKSTLVRALAEQLVGQVQQWVIDREGDFVTLREVGDFVLVGRGGDVPADRKSVKLLARRLMELGASAIFDLSELRIPEQREYVKLLFDELTHMPRALWHPLVVWLDEGHMFAPEKESAVSLPAVIDAASLWRKRGYCLALATQRLSKLDKDVAAELHNKVIGYTDDVDVKRAGDQLGMTTEQRAQLQLLEPGQFFARGPAISRASVMVHAPKPKTVPPPKGEARAVMPPAPEKVRAILGKLADLAGESEEELRTTEDLRRAVAERDREIRLLKKGGAVQTVEKPVVDQAAIDRAVAAERRNWAREMSLVAARCDRLMDAAGKVLEAAGSLKVDSAGLADRASNEPPPRRTNTVTDSSTRAPQPQRQHAVPRARSGDTSTGVTGTQQRMLNAIATYGMIGNSPTREAVAGFCGLSPTSGSYSNNLSALRTAGLIEDAPDRRLTLTEAGAGTANAQEAPTLDELHEMWCSKVTGTQANILRLIVAAHPKPMPRERIAESLNVSASSGSFSNNLSKLRTLGLIYNTGTALSASDVLFPEGL